MSVVYVFIGLVMAIAWLAGLIFAVVSPIVIGWTIAHYLGKAGPYLGALVASVLLLLLAAAYMVHGTFIFDTYVGWTQTWFEMGGVV